MRTDTIQHGNQADAASEFKSGIFIYAEAQVVFQGLVQSLERTFPDIQINLSSELADHAEFDAGVGLVLIHSEFTPDLMDSITRCKTRFPDASIALMIDENHDRMRQLNSLFDNKLVQGLLPFNLKLDIWLAVIWLLLNGGDYYPAGLIRSLEKGPAMSAGRPALVNGARSGPIDDRPIRTLTLREHEILQLLSEGLQNKIIADRLTLSVHTVKVHVHNLIRKLRAHNRTQATAIYRNSIEQRSEDAAIKSYNAHIVH